MQLISTVKDMENSAETTMTWSTYLVLDFSLDFLQIPFVLFAQRPSCRHRISFGDQRSFLLVCQYQHSRSWNLFTNTRNTN